MAKRSPRLTEAVKLGLLVLALLACGRGGCGRPSVKVKVAELPPDALDAARELGKAAATAKDADHLAGKLAAFLERLSYPVVSMDGERLVTKGYMSFPPKRGFLWEPLLAGVARATVKGDRRPASVVWRTLVPRATREQVAAIDTRTTFLNAAKAVAEKKGTTADAMLVTAIATDLETRGASGGDAWLDPTATLLLGLWFSLSAEKASPGVQPGMPADAPGLPRGLPGMPSFIPKLPRAPKALVAEGGSTPCGFLERAAREATALGEAREFGRGTGEWLSDSPVFGEVATLVRQVGDGPSAPRLVSDAVSGMGLAAFVEVTGEVSPRRVAYGDGPVTFEVKVESQSPFTQSQLDSFVGCLESASPSSVSELAPLRRLPAKGTVASLPIAWEGGDAFDPKQGTLSPGATTDASGRGSARFQVRPKGHAAGPTEARSFTLVAKVSPFPAGAGGIANRAVPLVLEIEVPASKDWQLVFKQNMLASGEGMSGGWTLDAEATVPFTVGANQELSGKGNGSWSYGFKGSAEGVTCTAPTERYPLSMQLTGKGPSTEGGSARFSLSDTASGGVNSTLTCTGPGGISVSVPMRGPAGGSFLKGSQADGFDMPLQDGASKSWPVSHQSAKGTAKVTLQAK